MLHFLKLTGPRLEILKDAKGPYGIGFVGNCQQLTARHSHNPNYELPKLIVRPDRLEEAGKQRQVYQCVFRHSAFRHTPADSRVRDVP